MANPSSPDGVVALGRIVGLFGIHGWVKVYSYVRPPEAILGYNPWLIRTGGCWKECSVVGGRVQGKSLVAHLEGYRDRDQASVLIGTDIAVALAQLPALPEGEYYWAQLEGLRVVTVDGRELGVVSHLFETGANDVMVVIQDKPCADSGKATLSQLIPYIRDVIKNVDLDSCVIVVEWDPDF